MPDEDRRQTLTRICEHLAPGGHLICRLHNLSVRAQSVDGQLHLIGAHARAGCHIHGVSNTTPFLHLHLSLNLNLNSSPNRDAHTT